MLSLRKFFDRLESPGTPQLVITMKTALATPVWRCQCGGATFVNEGDQLVLLLKEMAVSSATREVHSAR